MRRNTRSDEEGEEGGGGQEQEEEEEKEKEEEKEEEEEEERRRRRRKRRPMQREFRCREAIWPDYFRLASTYGLENIACGLEKKAVDPKTTPMNSKTAPVDSKLWTGSGACGLRNNACDGPRRGGELYVEGLGGKLSVFPKFKH